MNALLTTWPLSPLPTTLLLLAAILYLLLFYNSLHQLHPKEPPLVHTRIPYLGHILPLALQGGHYLRALGLSHLSTINNLQTTKAHQRNKPALTLALAPGRRGRMYIITSPALAHALQRRRESELSFEALLPDVVGRVMGLDGETEGIIRAGVEGRGQGKGFLAELHAMLAVKLGSGGGGVEGMVVRALGELGRGLEGFVEAGRGEGVTETPPQNLLPWVRHLIAPATARLLYGSNHPLKTPALEQAFWDFDHGLGRLLVSVFPAITARKAYAGREMLVAAFRGYLEAGQDDGVGAGADAIVKERIRIARAHGFGVDGVARSEVSFLFAGIVNTATTVFWMLVRIYADEGLLRTLRAELVGALVEATQEREEGEVRRLSLKGLLNSKEGGCPVLHAVYKEVLRLGSNHSSTRLVLADTVVAVPGGEEDGEVWLGKGGVVQIAGGVMHLDPAAWGEDVREFRPGRHLRGDREKEKGGDGGGGREKGRAAAAFRAFGGGRTVCPGRHFATGEILGFVAMVLLRFEMEGVDGHGQGGGEGKGGTRVPELDDYILPVHILEPVTGSPVRVRIKLREGRDGGRVEVVP